MPTVTRLLIEEDVIRVFAPDDEAVSRLDVPLSSTSTAGTALLIVDTTLGRGTSNANMYDARDIKVVELVGSGPAVGSITRVDDAGFDNTSTLTISPAFTGALESGADYIIYPRGLAPEIPVNAINDVLRNTQAPHIWLPSIIDDSDFSAGTVTAWATVGTPSTVPELVTTAPTLLGDNALHFIADAADEGTTSNVAAVHEGEQVVVWAVVRCNVGSCKVQLYNETASEEIKAVTVDEPAFTAVRFTETIPDECKQIRIRFLSAAASDDVYIMANIVLQITTGRPYPTPSWLVSTKQIMEAFYVPQGFSSEDTDSFVPFSQGLETRQRVLGMQSSRDVTPLHLDLGNMGRTPVALSVLRAFNELSSETSTTTADRDYVAKKAVSNILKARGEGAWRRWAGQAAKIARGKRYGGQGLVIEENPVVLV